MDHERYGIDVGAGGLVVGGADVEIDRFNDYHACPYTSDIGAVGPEDYNLQKANFGLTSMLAAIGLFGLVACVRQRYPRDRAPLAV